MSISPFIFLSFPLFYCRINANYKPRVRLICEHFLAEFFLISINFLNVNSAACFLLPCCTKFYFFRNFIINYPIVANCTSNFYPGCLSMCSTATRYEWCPTLCEVRHIESGDVTDTGNMYVLHCGTCPWRPSIWLAVSIPVNIIRPLKGYKHLRECR